MNQFETKVYNFIKAKGMVSRGDTVVVGLSGGADSVCLLLVLCRLAEQLGINKNRIYGIHVNHGIRGAEADRDADFSRELCQRQNVNFVELKKDISAYAKETGMSVEEAGRSFRYASFQDYLRQVSLTEGKIAVAHNKNDLAETVLFQLVRGSGLRGLAGIPAVRDNVIRPLLCVERQEIEAYLRELGQGYCVDSTNASLNYDRNRIRHQILPVMQEMNARAIDHIYSCAEEALTSYEYIHTQAKQLCDVGIDGEQEDKVFGRQLVLPVSDLYKSGQVMQGHIIQEALSQIAGQSKDISRKHVLLVANLLYQNTGARVQLPYGIQARRSYDSIILSNKPEETQDYYLSICPNHEYNIPNWGKLSVAVKNWEAGDTISKNDYTKMLDYGKIKDGLCLRTPEDGDYIVINDSGDKKKLNRVFIDRKIDRELRKNWPVLACGQEVIWVLGLRFSTAYNIDETTTKALCMDYRREGE